MQLRNSALGIAAFATAWVVAGPSYAAPIATATITTSGPIYEDNALVNYRLDVTSSYAIHQVVARVLWGDGSNPDYRSGNASPITASHTFANDGIYSVSLQQGQPGPGSDPFNSYVIEAQPAGPNNTVLTPAPISALTTVTVLNRKPVIVTAPASTVELDPLNPVFSFTAAATDLGPNDVLTYDWELTGNALYDDHRGKTVNKTYSTPGTYNLGLRVFDGTDNVYSNFVLTVAPVPEPAAIGLLGIAGLGLLGRRRR